MKSFALLAVAANAQCVGDETIQGSATVSCSANGMEVVIDGCAVDNMVNLDINAAMLGNDASEGCKGTYNSDTNVYVFSSGIGECNTQAVHNNTAGTLTYSNFVRAEQGLQTGPITRVRSMNIDFSCEFEMMHTLSLAQGFSPTLSHFEVSMPMQTGSFSVEMAVYTDDSFTTAADGALDIQVPEPIHIQVHSDDMTVQLESCWATPR